MSDVIIIGSGPAGCTAAIYVARAGYTPVVLHGNQAGGQLMTTTDVENFPGFPNGIMGPQLCMDMIKQAEKFGTEFKTELVNKVEYGKEGSKHKVITDSATYEAHAVVIATGSSAKLLSQTKGHDDYWGKGVSACATCDGFFFRGKDVAVVGGGDTAMEEATYLAKICNKVYLIHRRNEFRASQVMIDRCKEVENIEMITPVVIDEITGDDTKVTGLNIKNMQDESISSISVDGLFYAIGHNPNTLAFGEELAKDEEGYVINDYRTQTNIAGVFCAGDVGDKLYRQGIAAAGSGCKAGIEAIRYIENL